MVATAPMCWGMTAAAALVVILGTQYYDSSGATGGQDYPVTDLLQMMGRASRPDLDQSGRCAPCLALTFALTRTGSGDHVQHSSH